MAEDDSPQVPMADGGVAPLSNKEPDSAGTKKVVTAKIANETTTETAVNFSVPENNSEDGDDETEKNTSTDEESDGQEEKESENKKEDSDEEEEKDNEDEKEGGEEDEEEEKRKEEEPEEEKDEKTKEPEQEKPEKESGEEEKRKNEDGERGDEKEPGKEGEEPSEESETTPKETEKPAEKPTPKTPQEVPTPQAGGGAVAEGGVGAEGGAMAAGGAAEGAAVAGGAAAAEGGAVAAGATAGLPVILIILAIIAVIFIIIFIVAIFIGAKESGVGGTTSLQASDRNNPEHVALVSDAGCRSSVPADCSIANQVKASSAMVEIATGGETIRLASSATTDPAKVEIYQALAEMIFGKTGSDGSNIDSQGLLAKMEQAAFGNGDGNSDLNKINQIIADFDAQIEKLRKSSPKAGEILAVQKNSDGEIVLDEKTGLPIYLDPEVKKFMEKVRGALEYLKVEYSVVQSPRLAISSTDLAYIRNYQVDIRVVKALLYLTDPVAKGGAGHQKIKVRRIKADYNSEGKKFTKEWYYENDADRAISPHFTGQAFDVAVVDQVQRRLFKKGILRKKIKKLAPVDIVLAYQSNKPGLGGGASLTNNGETMSETYDNTVMGALLNQIRENTGYDLSGAVGIGTGSVSEISRNIGLAILGQELDIPIDLTADNSSFEKLVRNLGTAGVAQCLNLPADSIKNIAGLSSDEANKKIGQAFVEKQLNLSSNALNGATSDDILASVGKRELESTLGLRSLSFDYWQSGASFKTYIGQIRAETILDFPPGSLTSNSFAEIKKAVGEERFNKAFNNPARVDALLGLDYRPQTQGYAWLFATGAMNPTTFKEAVAKPLLEAKITNYNKYAKSLPTKSFLGKTIIVPSGPATEDLQDESLGLPEGSANKLLNNNDRAVFRNIGAYKIAGRSTDSDEEREVIYQWLTDSRYRGKNLSEMAYTIKKANGVLDINLASEVQAESEKFAQKKELQKNINANKKSSEESFLQKTGATGQETPAPEIEETPDRWIFMNENEMLDKPSGLANDTFHKLFVSNQPQEAFTQNGSIKTTEIFYQNGKASEKDSLLDKLDTENDKAQKELDGAKDSLSGGKKNKLQESALEALRKQIQEKENALALVQRKKERIMATPSSAQAGKTKNSDALCSSNALMGIFAVDAINTGKIDDLVSAFGAGKFEAITGLPADRLLGMLEKNKKQDAVDNQEVGRLQIETKLDPSATLTAGWFSGQSLDRIVANILESQHPGRYLTLFEKGIDLALAEPADRKQAENTLLTLFGFGSGYSLFSLGDPDTFDISGAVSIASSIASATDQKIGVPNGSTKSLFLRVLSPENYAKLTGETSATNQAVLTPQAKESLEKRAKRKAEQGVKSALDTDTIGATIIEGTLNATLTAGWWSNKDLGSTIGNLVLAMYPQLTDPSPKKAEGEKKLLSLFGLKDRNTFSEVSGSDKSRLDDFDKKLNIAVGGDGQTLVIPIGRTYEMLTGKISVAAYTKGVG